VILESFFWAWSGCEKELFSLSLELTFKALLALLASRYNTRSICRSEALRESESSNKDLTRQVQELTLTRSELHGERDALQSELSDASDTIRDLQSQLDAANAALQQMKQDMELRLRESEEEIENSRYVDHTIIVVLNDLYEVVIGYSVMTIPIPIRSVGATVTAE